MNELSNTYDNKSSNPVMKIQITRDDFDYKNIPKVVTEYWESPAYNGM